MTAEPVTAATCGYGDCDDPAVGAIVVRHAPPDVWHLDGERVPGVVLLCPRHWGTPPDRWEPAR